jgi:hypothetical protein
MSRRTEKSIFYHIPKTGGFWVRAALRQTIPGVKPVKRCSARHPLGLVAGHQIPAVVKKKGLDVNDITGEKLFSFTFVRQPLSWYQSFWAHRKRDGIKNFLKPDSGGNYNPLNFLWDDNFENFISNVLKKYPKGYLTELFQCFVGQDGKALDFVGKQENLAEDLMTALSLAGEEFDERVISRIPRENTASSREEFRHFFQISRRLKNKLLAREQWITDTFYQPQPEKMKNLLIYISPDKKFATKSEILTKIQIDNSLELGWQPEDLVLVTNFDYRYRGVSSIVVDDYRCSDQRYTKIPAINELFTKGLIEDSLYWFHDHDAFQLIPFKVNLSADAGFTVYRRPPVWNAGSFFFKPSAADIFLWIEEYMNLKDLSEQDALTYMWQHNLNQINDRYQLMNITYNLGVYHATKNFKRADLPIRVAHFHPHKKHHLNLFREILSPQLLKILDRYDI